MIKKFQEFIHEIKNTNVFIKIDIVPFKVLPIDCNALIPALDPIFKTFFILGFRYGYQKPFSILTIIKMKLSLHQRVCIKFCGFNGAKMLKKCYSIENKLLCVAQVFVSLSRMTNAMVGRRNRKRR